MRTLTAHSHVTSTHVTASWAEGGARMWRRIGSRTTTKKNTRHTIYHRWTLTGADREEKEQNRHKMHWKWLTQSAVFELGNKWNLRVRRCKGKEGLGLGRCEGNRKSNARKQTFQRFPKTFNSFRSTPPPEELVLFHQATWHGVMLLFWYLTQYSLAPSSSPNKVT